MKKILKTQKESSGVLPYFLFFLLSCIAGVIFSTLCIFTASWSFAFQNRITLSILSSIICIAVYVFSIKTLHFGKTKLLRLLLAGHVLLLSMLALIYIGEKTGFFQLLKNQDELQNFLQRAGLWMPICFILLQYFQVTILPIPSLVTTLVGVAVFGAWQAAVYSFIGIFLGSLTAFFLGRKLGNKTVSWIVGVDTLQKWQIKLKGKDKLLLTLMFLLPLFPDDILCFVAGLSSMTSRYFISMIAVTRFLAIFASCFSVEFIPFTTWWGVVIWVIISLILFVICAVVYKNADAINEKIKKLTKIIKK